MEKGDLWKNFENVNNWIRNSDNKVMIILGFIGALGFLVKKEIFLIDFEQIEVLIWLNILFVFSFMINYIASIYFLFKSINPSVNVKYNSLIFFANIANKKYKNFSEEISDKNYNLEDDIKKQIHINSKIATLKYRAFKKSLFTLSVSLILYLVIKFIWL